ncbi:MAG: nucleoside recognition domain-containing protein [Bacilli bacterium]
MVNKIWGFFIIIGISFAFLTNNMSTINEEILKSTTISIELILKIFPVMALWLGIMNIAKISGLLKKLSDLLSPVLSKLFPTIPKNHESLGYISSNVVVNMLGLGNAATPFGLKAMKSLQQLNKKKDEATEAMVTFLVLNTSGLTIIPTTVISLRMMYKSLNPTEIVIPTLIATICATIAGLTLDTIIRKKNKYD